MSRARDRKLQIERSQTANVRSQTANVGLRKLHMYAQPQKVYTRWLTVKPNHRIPGWLLPSLNAQTFSRLYPISWKECKANIKSIRIALVYLDQSWSRGRPNNVVRPTTLDRVLAILWSVDSNSPQPLRVYSRHSVLM